MRDIPPEVAPASRELLTGTGLYPTVLCVLVIITGLYFSVSVLSFLSINVPPNSQEEPRKFPSNLMRKHHHVLFYEFSDQRGNILVYSLVILALTHTWRICIYASCNTSLSLELELSVQDCP